MTTLSLLGLFLPGEGAGHHRKGRGQLPHRCPTSLHLRSTPSRAKRLPTCSRFLSEILSNDQGACFWTLSAKIQCPTRSRTSSCPFSLANTIYSAGPAPPLISKTLTCYNCPRNLSYLIFLSFPLYRLAIDLSPFTLHLFDLKFTLVGFVTLPFAIRLSMLLDSAFLF